MKTKSSAFVSLLLVALLMAGGSVAAQSTPEASVEELQERIAALEEENEELTEENERLKQRIEDMSGPSRTPREGSGDTETEGAPTLQIGETWTSDEWSITATYIEFTPTLTSHFETNEARGVFAIIHLTVVNEGGAPVPFPYDDMVLNDSDGRAYTAPFEPMFNLVAVVMGLEGQYGDFQPGLPYDTGIIFDIPATSTGLTLTTSTEVFRIELD